jgi:hypothetical protein
MDVDDIGKCIAAQGQQFQTNAALLKRQRWRGILHLLLSQLVGGIPVPHLEV